MKILKDQSAHTTTRTVGVAIYIYILYIYIYIYIYTFIFVYIYSNMYLCIYLYIWLLNYKRLKTFNGWKKKHNMAIIDAQKASWMCFYGGYFNIIRTAWDTEDRKFSWIENGHRKNWREWHQLLAALPPAFVAFCQFCHELLPPS